jgi:hypothetical protein
MYNLYSKCILAYSANLLRAYNKILNTVLSYLTFFNFVKINLTIFGYDQQNNLFIYKVKNTIKNPLFFLK